MTTPEPHARAYWLHHCLYGQRPQIVPNVMFEILSRWPAGFGTKTTRPTNEMAAERVRATFEPLMRYVKLPLKRKHPAWGLDVALLHMSRRPS